MKTNSPRYPPNRLLYRVVGDTAWLVVSKMYQTEIGQGMTGTCTTFYILAETNWWQNQMLRGTIVQRTRLRRGRQEQTALWDGNVILSINTELWYCIRILHLRHYSSLSAV